MEVGAADGSASSHRRFDSVMQRLQSAAPRLFKYVLLALALVSCSTLLVATSHRYNNHGSGIDTAFPSFSSVWSAVWRFEETDDIPVRILDRRQLVEFEGGNNAAAFVNRGKKNETEEEKDIEALVEKVKLKVIIQDDDYENVALIRKVGSEDGAAAQDEGDGNEKDLVQEETLDGGEHEKSVEGEAKVVELTGVEKLLDMLEEDPPPEEDGRFNKTISTQEGVLETVARVGGHSFDEEDEAAETDLEVLTQKNEEVNASDLIKETSAEEGTTAEVSNANDTNVKDPIENDVTWLDRIMGQSEQPRKVDGPPDGRNASLVQLKKNATREKPLEDNAGYHQVEDVPRLIDREDNEYVISNPGKNRMKLQEDLTLISDIIVVIVAAAFGGTTCGLLGQPVILGYLAAGMVVGPGGLHLVHELVQVETLAQFGVVFLLFVLGVEFNPGKMQGVHGVALGGGCIQIGTAMLLGGLLGSSVPQGVFIGAFLSMSSTAVVVKCLMDSKMGSTEHGQIMLGTLILQDCALGLLLAIMPALAAKGSGVITFAIALSREGMLLLGFCAGAWVLAKYFIPRFLRSLVQLTKFNTELYLIGVIGVCLLLALISQSLGLSLEVGAFVGGLVLSGGIHTERTLHQVEPIRNVFAALFLASIGMVMHPIFLWQHKDILLASLAVVFFGKACLFAGVVRAFGYGGKTSMSVGIALAQIGEFAFILLSRAQGLGLVSKKLYLLLMGTSALSLVLTPFAFKIVIRLMSSGQSSFRKPVNLKPMSSFGVPALHLSKGQTDIGGRGQDGGEPSIWSVTGPNVASNETTEIDEQKSNSNGQDQLLELRDVEDGRGVDYSSSPAGLVLRRPFHNVVTGKWHEWKKELQEHEVDDHRK